MFFSEQDSLTLKCLKIFDGVYVNLLRLRAVQLDTNCPRNYHI